MARFDTAGYLRRLCVPDPGPPGVPGLHLLHAAQVERVPYEALDVQLGRMTSIDPYTAAERIIAGRGGYCYHLNGAFSLLLRSLGYDVRRHRAGVQNRDDAVPPGAARANHLALTVHGLPSDECPSGVWLVDAGLGDGLHAPLPLREAEFAQGPFRFRIRPSDVERGGWRFDHDPCGSFTGMDVEPRPAVIDDFVARHVHLSTSPESGYVRTCVVMRRDAAGADVLTGCVLRRIGGDTGRHRVLETEREWYAALGDVFGLRLADLGPTGRTALWRRVRAAHADRTA